MGCIAVLGTLDTKGAEHAFVAEEIRRRGHRAVLVDVGTGAAAVVPVDFTRHQVAAAAGLELDEITARNDRGECMAAMCRAAPLFLKQLADSGTIDGVISLGGGGGTAIGTAAMRALPLGFPKLMLSTLAAGNTAAYLGIKDIVMMPSIVDVAGLNRLSRLLFTRAAGAICGMVEADVKITESRPLVVASMFGNTTACVTHAQQILEAAGYEVLVFAATGTGGRAMEALIESGLVSGVLDLTTTEWADELVGGVLSAGPERLDAAAKAKVPAVIGLGCCDMVNFGEAASVPSEFASRTFYQHNPQVTLMRTNATENAALGHLICQKLNTYQAPVTLMISRKSLSALGELGRPFHDPLANLALFETCRLNAAFPIVSLDSDINSQLFATACAEKLLELMRAHAFTKTPISP